jgi:2'-5' RNA ligase
VETPEPKKLRAFIAVTLQHSVVADLLEQIAPLKAQFSANSLRWVAAENFHFTLAFLGDIDREAVFELSAIIDDLTGRYSAFSLTLGSYCFFPDKLRPSALVILPEPCVHMERLQSELAAGLKKAGFSLSRQKYRPHLTLARVRGHKPLPSIAANHGVTLKIPVNTVSLIRSELRAQGSSYSLIYKKALKA